MQRALSGTKYAGPLLAAALLVALSLGAGQMYPLYHSTFEILNAAVSLGVASVALHSWRFEQDGFLAWVGAAHLPLAALTVAHLLSSPELGLLAVSPDKSTRLAVAGGYVQALALTASPIFLRLKRPPRLSLDTALWLAGIVAVGALLWVTCVTVDDASQRTHLAPGLTAWLTYATLPVGALLLTRWNQGRLSPSVVRFLMWAIVATMLGNIALSLRHPQPPLWGALGHFARLTALTLMYVAVSRAGMTEAQDRLSRALQWGEEAQRQSEARYRSLAELSPDAVLVHRGDHCLYANPSSAALFGVGSPQHLVDIGLRDLARPLGPARAVEEPSIHELHLYHSGEFGTRVLECELTLRNIRRQLEVSEMPIVYEGQPAIQTTIRDVTERELMEQQLRDANELLERRVAERTAEAEQRSYQLLVLASELVRTEERERRRLAQVLHDHLQQLLVAAKLQVGLTQRRADDPDLDKALDQVLGLLDESIASTRSLTVELSPPVLYEAGLVPALQWLASAMSERYGLMVQMTGDPVDGHGHGRSGESIDEEIRVLLFQAVRELLFNIVKHAGVRRATVEVSRLTAGWVKVVVSDAGRGFNPGQLDLDTTLGGFGLFSIRERLGLFGGRMDVESEPLRGSRVTLLVPMRRPEADAFKAPGKRAPKREARSGAQRASE